MLYMILLTLKLLSRPVLSAVNEENQWTDKSNHFIGDFYYSWLIFIALHWSSSSPSSLNDWTSNYCYFVRLCNLSFHQQIFFLHFSWVDRWHPSTTASWNWQGVFSCHEWHNCQRLAKHDQRGIRERCGICSERQRCVYHSMLMEANDEVEICLFCKQISTLYIIYRSEYSIHLYCKNVMYKCLSICNNILIPKNYEGKRNRWQYTISSAVDLNCWAALENKNK